MNNLKLVNLLVVFFTALIFSSSSVASVRPISGGIELLENDVLVAKKVMLACTDGFIKQAIDDQWCDVKLGSVCAANQKAVARLTCRNVYRAKIGSQNDLQAGKNANTRIK